MVETVLMFFLTDAQWNNDGKKNAVFGRKTGCDVILVYLPWRMG